MKSLQFTFPLAAVLAGLFSVGAYAAENSYSSSVAQWRQEAGSRLVSEHGPLAAIGMFWLHPGENHIGSYPSNEVLLPADVAPSQVGVVKLEGDELTLETTGAVPVALGGAVVTHAAWKTNAVGKLPEASIGRLKLELLDKEQGRSIRVYDPNSSALRDFPGQQWYAVDAKWLVPGHFTPFDAPKTLEYETALGSTRSTQILGVVSFERNGKQYQLEVQPSGKEGYVGFFFDTTTGKATYAGGRVVPIAKLDGDKVALDFNKAYNMPCAVSPYFACEIAPKQNHLSLAIPVGEKKPAVKVQRVASAPSYLK